MEIWKHLVDYGVWEIAILIAVIYEGIISHLHYRETKSKKERANMKRKATKILKKVWRD